MGQAGAG
jgi:3-hydroxyisobutyrate dehydrogenase